VHPRATALLLFVLACQRASPPPPPASSCLDAQLAAQGLNQYGDPPDTNYAGGTPLFDEKSGQRIDREAYVFAKRPGIARACSRDAGP
jgi:hypothetical protein